MIKLLWSGFIIMCMASGCGYNGTPTRHNDFAPLTSIRIVAAVPAIEATHTIAALTSTKLTVIGDFSGQFTRDITDQVTLWSSSSPTVADFLTSPNNNRVLGKLAGSANLTATVKSVTSAVYPLTVSTANVTAITITPTNPSIPNGLTTQFAATGTFSDGTIQTTQDLTFDATWSSTPGTFATVSNTPASKGLAQAIAVGTETITASFGSILTIGTTTLTVTAPILQSIAVTPANSSISGSSKTVNFIATGTFSDKTTQIITTTVTWSSSATGVATIIASNGVATSFAAGTTSISATQNGVSGSTNLTVTALVLNLTPATLNLSVVGPSTGFSNSGQFKLTATTAGGTVQDVTSISAWSSSSPTTASVNPTTGFVTAVSVGGPVTITATYLGQSVTATVTVQL